VISPDLLNIMICPACGSAVREVNDSIVCTECRNQYPIENGIPVLLVDRAKKAKP
jgi:uncharacterized protein YbaR (Trm112 family)